MEAPEPLLASDLRSSSKLVAVVLWSRVNKSAIADGRGRAWSSIAWIQGASGLGRSAVFAALSELEFSGWIERGPVPDLSGKIRPGFWLNESAVADPDSPPCRTVESADPDSDSPLSRTDGSADPDDSDRGGPPSRTDESAVADGTVRRRGFPSLQEPTKNQPKNQRNKPISRCLSPDHEELRSELAEATERYGDPSGFELTPPVQAKATKADRDLERACRLWERVEAHRVRVIPGARRRVAAPDSEDRVKAHNAIVALVKRVRKLEGLTEDDAWQRVGQYGERACDEAAADETDWGVKLRKFRVDWKEWRVTRYQAWASGDFAGDAGSAPQVHERTQDRHGDYDPGEVWA